MKSTPAMKTRLLLLAVFPCLLFVDSTIAQGDAKTWMPTFESTMRRLDAVEAENRLLRSELEGWLRSGDAESVRTTSIAHVDEFSNGIQNNGGNNLPPQGCSCDRHPCQCPPTPAPCVDCPHVTTLSPYFNLRVFGSLTGELIFAEARPVIPSGVVLITPDFGQDTETAEVHAKSSSLGVLLAGPQIAGLQSGGTFLTYLYGETFQEDKYGFYIVRAFGELKNEFVRFAMGLNGDVVNPRSPTTINFNAANGAGNLGFFRGQFLAEKYFHFGSNAQLTAQFALSDPVATSFASFDQPPFNLLETNGWPNVEARAALALGPKPLRPSRPRPFELGLSGLVGQLRRTDTPVNHIHDVWALGADVHVGLNEAVGFNGEFFTGQAIGNYNAMIFLVDNGAFGAVRSTGGWGEVYVNWTPCLHSHFGYGIDDPLNSTLTAGLPTRNELVFANIIWDVTKNLEIGFEVSRWETSYMAPLRDNEAMAYHTRVRLKF
ncbi:MAG: hypothetical protein VX988_09375 [Planctomycetota bacterium]|nr:hypothetical protein [Planctomycetota bacterium]